MRLSKVQVVRTWFFWGFFERALTNLFVVYFCWPSPDGTQSWHLVGHVTNQKPSLIFKVNNLKGKQKFHLIAPKHHTLDVELLNCRKSSLIYVK